MEVVTEYASLAASVDVIESQLADIAKTQEEHTKAIAAVIEKMDERFTAVDRRFAAVDKRFDGIESKINVLIELVTTRLPPLQPQSNA
jgi:hypothetical protein